MMVFPNGGIGRHASLRNLYRKMCRFDSYFGDKNTLEHGVTVAQQFLDWFWIGAVCLGSNPDVPTSAMVYISGNHVLIRKHTYNMRRRK